LKESKGIRIKECGLGEECQAQRGVSSTKRSVKHKEECQAQRGVSSTKRSVKHRATRDGPTKQATAIECSH
jgi:hypothetical protein